MSFKLETDESILRAKSEGAIQKYNVDLVVGNILSTRYDAVTFFDGRSVVEIRRKDDQPIEDVLIKRVADLHNMALLASS